MRKLTAGFATSIDNFIQGPNGEIDWITFDKEHFKELAQSWKKIDAMFHGRKTYEQALAGNKNAERMSPFAHMKHYVFSRALKKVDKGFILVNGDLTDEVTKIKNERGGDIAVFGGAELLSSLLNLELIDELNLAICPVLLGKGKAFFQDLNKRSYWKLEEVKSHSSGLVSIRYSKINKPAKN